MTKKIAPFKIIGRYGHSCTLTKLKLKKYLVSFTDPVYRLGFHEDPYTLSYIDPSGGPFISVGSSLREFHPELPDKPIAAITRDKETNLIIIEL